MSKQTRRLSQIASQIRYDVIERVYDESEKALESGESTTRYTVEYILAEVIKLLSQEMAGFIWDDIDEEEMEKNED
jgi:hypothetical protein